MSDPEIIKSNTPHRVSMPEGSSNAVGKKAEVGETSIRKVLSEGTGESNEIESDKATLKAPPPKLSLDEEIAAAKELVLKSKALRAEKEGVHTDDELRAGKAGHKVGEDLQGKIGVGHDEELTAAKQNGNPDNELRAENGDAIASDDLRAKQNGVTGNELRAPKEGASSGDLKAPKDVLDSLADLLAPKEAAKSDAELRSPKELVKTNSAAGLSSTAPAAALNTGTTESKDSKPATSNATQDGSDTSSEVDDDTSNEAAVMQSPGPEMDFPARVVHLKIENDNLRSTLDKLESEP